MDFLELKEPSAAVTMLVTRVSRVKSNFGQDYLFTGNVEHGRIASVSVPEKAAERQGERLGLAEMALFRGRRIIISRSDEPGANGKLFWNIDLAGEDEGDGSDVPAAEDYGRELKADPSGNGSRRVQAPPPDPRPAQRELSESQARPRASEPVTDDELDAAEQKKRARMARLVHVWHKIWEAELEFQIQASERVAKKLGCDPAEVTAASANQGAASQFIEFNRHGLI